MSTVTIAQRVIGCIAEHLGLDAAQIKPDSELVFDFNCDSLDLVELCMAIENEFDTRIDDDRFVQLKTVQHVIDHVSELTGVPA